MRDDLHVDIRNARALAQALHQAKPDVVVHLAAQPLVRRSYAEPRETVETNVMGTFNVLEAIREMPSVKASLLVTTDKVYRNEPLLSGYREEAALGGHDPYSASKAMADLLIQSWASSFDPVPTAIARAGNVVGGGDTGRDRLVPDLVAAFRDGQPALVRNPAAVRPWQHVLDCLSGYLLLIDRLIEGDGSGAWNFGPDPASLRTVADVADLSTARWGPGATWVTDPDDHPHETAVLALDSTKAREVLAWRDRLTFEQAVGWTVDWERRRADGEDPQYLCREQLAIFRDL
jgi:CDP-glucose 4,6-dehydratase